MRSYRFPCAWVVQTLHGYFLSIRIRMKKMDKCGGVARLCTYCSAWEYFPLLWNREVVHKQAKIELKSHR